MPHELLSAADVDFLVFDWLRAGELTKTTRFADHTEESLRAAIDMSSRLAARFYLPHYVANDQQEPRLEDGRVVLVPDVQRAVDAFAEAGLLAAPQAEEHGGVDLPLLVHHACLAWFQTANLATTAYSMLSIANANLLLRHGSASQVQRFAIPLLEGRWFGTMCLTEPAVGSALGDITTRADPRPDGTYRLFGSKTWISGGDHELGDNILHLVLARIAGAPKGAPGLSLFAVPKRLTSDSGGSGEPNDVTTLGLNHKMGYRGTANAALNFGNGDHRPGGEAGAVGELVGEPGRGLAIMFDMMNEARIGVGASAAALGYAGYRTALHYARDRRQGRPLSEPDPQQAPVPIVQHPDVKRMLLAAKSYAEGSLALVLYAARLCDVEKAADEPEERDRAALLLSVLTPVVKSWPAQWALAANDLALQVHGGYGYSREYPVEQLYRDNRVNAIHEGTHGIQALDLLGRKLTMRDGAGLRLLAEVIGETVHRASGTDLAAHAATLAAARDRLTATVAAVWRDGRRDRALENASLFLEAAGHVVVAWLWLDQALALDRKSDGDFVRGKLAACQYFFTYELPRVIALFDRVASEDQFIGEHDERWL